MGKTGKKRSKVQMPAGIRNKMMAAVSMLMVSCIMLVSSTYAWFTLSTAPEITGITTNVGANGNLEMMLLNADSYASSAENLGVESKVGDSSAKQSVTKANETWGNVVDLASSTYGLSSVTLMPSKLSVDENETSVITNSILNTPTYGKDGRVVSVTNPAMTGRYDSSWVYDAAAVGVRALGTSSGTTLRLSEYNTALYNASSFASKAQLTAETSLKANAQSLADLIIEKAQGAESHDEKYLTNIDSIISGVAEANAHIKSLIKNALLAWNLSETGAAAELSDEEVNAIKDVIMADDFDITNISDTVGVPASIQSAIEQYKATEDALAEAKTERANITAIDGKVTWAQLSPALTPLVDPNKMAVSSKNMTLAENKQEEILSAVFDDVTSGDNTLPITMMEGSGVYYNIAKVCGAYTVSDWVTVSYKDLLNNKSVKFSMTQDVTGDIIVTTIVNDIKTNGKAPEVSLDGESTIALSDTYGYMLDFGFRTNAASSNLLLQTEGIQRVYSTGEEASTSAATQGGGSYMEFTTANPASFSVKEMRALMSAIRVAFVKPIVTDAGTTYSLLALGGLDITASDPDNEGIVNYEGGTVVGDDTLKADVVLFNYSYDSTNGTIKKGDKLVETTTNADGTTSTTPVTTITALDQNVAAKVSVIVYLDGTIVDNTMVANANNSMSGKLNLQFSSDATLVPMDNAGMKAGGEKALDAPEPNYGAAITTKTETITFNGKTYTVSIADGYSIYEADDGYTYYKANDSEEYVMIDTSDYTALKNCPAFTITEVTTTETTTPETTTPEDDSEG